MSWSPPVHGARSSWALLASLHTSSPHAMIQEMQETWVQSLGQEDPLEKRMATHSSVLAWEIPRTEEPDGPQSTVSQTVRHYRVHAHMCARTHTHTHTHTHMK